jgi:hypothetical protein
VGGGTGKAEPNVMAIDRYVVRLWRDVTGAGLISVS